ncbi:hypothetical protein kuro4_00230 [Gelria sp. Kuro-4]|nr:hypothetical protein kuro4_00230 [Gelria sp. Kuro-4]
MRNLDRFADRMPWEGKARCEDCGAPVPFGRRLCRACTAARYFDRHEDDYLLEEGY